MSEWKTYRLGEICDVRDGTHDSPKQSLTGKPLVTSKNIKGGIINLSSTYLISNEDYQSINKRSCVHQWDILFSMIGTVGELAIVKNEPQFAIKNIGLFKMNGDQLLSYWIYYYLHSDNAQEDILKNIKGSTQQYIALKDLRLLPVALPPIEIRQRLVKILKSFDDKIELNRRINANLEAQAQALFRSWFVDFEPFRDAPFVDSELGKIPQGWKVGTLSEVADITMGQSPKGSSYNEEGNGIIFYQGRAEFGNRFPSIRLYTTEPTRIAEINSVLLSVRAPVGDINVAKNKCCIGRGLASIKSKQGYDSFILYLLQSLKPLLEQYNGEGTVFGCVNRKEIEGLPIIIPKESVINEFERIAENIDSEIKNLTIEQETLSALRDTLLPKLMAGEINVE